MRVQSAAGRGTAGLRLMVSNEFNVTKEQEADECG